MRLILGHKKARNISFRLFKLLYNPKRIMQALVQYQLREQHRLIALHLQLQQ